MKPTIKQDAGSNPDPEFIAQQLRKPSGSFAPKIGEKMNQVNKPLYDLTFDVMDLQEGDKLLEIGFGNGQFFGELFSKEPALQISAIDFSDEMVELAKQNNQGTISSGELDIRLGDSEAIPFSDQSFNKVFCNMVVYFWNEPEKHLKEIQRVLKPGGIFYTGIRTRESMLAFPFVKYGFNLYSRKEWEKILIQNGFSYGETHNRIDPKIEVDGNKVHLESCCIVAEKKQSY